MAGLAAASGGANNLPEYDLRQNRLLYYRGRTALAAGLRALGVGPGHEVALQAYTCMAVPEAVLALGAKPLYIDLGGTSYTMSPDTLAQRITTETKAIVVQHTFGLPADVKRINAIAEARNIPVIEDCCHTLSSTIDGKPVGEFGAAAFYSFEWGKPVVAGIGGALRINDPALLEQVEAQFADFNAPGLLRSVRLSAQYASFRLSYRPQLYWHLRRIYRTAQIFKLAEANHRIPADLNEYQLRMSGSTQRRLQRALDNRGIIDRYCRRLVEIYRTAAAADSLKHPLIFPGWKVRFARYPLQTEAKTDLLRAARRAGIELADWYTTPVHPLSGKNLEAFGYYPGLCPNAEQRCRETITLPVHSRVSFNWARNTSAWLRTAAI